MPHSTQSEISPERPVLIIGAGLSGLTTARLLTNHGIPNILFEASGPERSQGFSISLRPWGYTALLEALGGLPLRSLTKGVAPDRFIGGSGWVDQTMRNNANGEILIHPDPEKMEPIVRANRNALRAWIADCGDDELDIRYRHELKSFSGVPGDMTAVFKSGAKYKGSLIIGADGVHSAARSQVLPHIRPEVVPVVVYHGEFKLSHEDFDRIMRPHMGDANILAGVGDGFNTPFTVCDVSKDGVSLDWSYSRSSTGDDDPLYRPNATIEEAKQIPQALLDEIAARDLAEPWSTILSPESIKTHHVFAWVSRCVGMTREEVDKASAQGICFAGDSWHAMPIFGGEGGNHAILDGIELAEAIRKSEDDLQGAVKTFYAGSFKRCQDAVKRSRQRFFVLHRPMSQWLEIAAKMALPA